MGPAEGSHFVVARDLAYTMQTATESWEYDGNMKDYYAIHLQSPVWVSVVVNYHHFTQLSVVLLPCLLFPGSVIGGPSPARLGSPSL